ncbi:MAG: GTPase HflX [Bdellovibrionales bacterium]|nr:GTPase HflX [Bdellovibrionales bacterium]
MTKKLSVILVGIQLPNVLDFDFENSLQELGRLATTLGYDVIGQFTQKRPHLRGPTVLGGGRLQKLATLTGGRGVVSKPSFHKLSKAALRNDQNIPPQEELPDAEFGNEGDEPSASDFSPQNEKADTVLFDCELTPSQIKKLTDALGVPVLDRTGVIIEIFGRHARTKMAQIQVEIARLAYLAPRLRESQGSSERQGGGLGGKGAGETTLELDKRRVRDRIKALKEELVDLHKEETIRRSKRAQENTVALVGYTNAGKSSLMRALTGSSVLVADQLFATLETTIRTLTPETTPKILISDTVGFINKLPHNLVASFKSTLDEALNATLLLYVLDASDPAYPSQLSTTKEVMAEVGAANIPSFLILNKKDRLNNLELDALKNQFPQALFISSRDPKDISYLRQVLIDFFEQNLSEEDFFVPYSTQGIIGEIRSKTKVINEAYDEKGISFKVRASAIEIQKLKEWLHSVSKNKTPQP